MAHTVRLTRLEENYIFGTFGVLTIDGKVFCVTLEPPDELNEVNISSIPTQQYTCKRYSSARYPNTFQIMNIPGRTKVLFHAGNFVKNTEGCILLARKFGVLRKGRGVLNSGETFKQFMEIMDGVDEFHLTIVEHY